MGDGTPRTCEWCGAPLPDDRAGIRRYCRTAHRQAAFRARRRDERRLRTAFNPQVAMAWIADDLAVRTETLKDMLAELAARQKLAGPGLHSRAVAGLDSAVDDLIGCAVIADRRSGATWIQIGTALGLTAEAARARYGHRRMAVEWPNPL